MKIFKFFLFIGIITLADQKCKFPMKTIDSLDCFYDLFEYTPGYRELYSYKNHHPELVGFPKAVHNAKVDLPIELIIGEGHITVTSIGDEHIEFYGNKHLVLMNIGWAIFLIFLIFFSPCIILFKMIFRNRMICFIYFIEYFILVFLMHVYYRPLIGFTPDFGKFRDNKLESCTIIDEPAFGLEFSISGIFYGEHFILSNDWVKLKCPINLSVFLFCNVSSSNLQDLIRVKSENIPDKLGIIHIATQKLIFHRSNDKNHI
jgi:hypothetical protein